MLPTTQFWQLNLLGEFSETKIQERPKLFFVLSPKQIRKARTIFRDFFPFPEVMIV
jgi:hypothetical protein